MQTVFRAAAFVFVLFVTKKYVFGEGLSTTVFCPSDKPHFAEIYKNGCDLYTEGDPQQIQCLKFTGCTACPNNGHCDDNGKLKCAAGYLREQDICTENLLVR